MGPTAAAAAVVALLACIALPTFAAEEIGAVSRKLAEITAHINITCGNFSAVAADFAATAPKKYPKPIVHASGTYTGPVAADGTPLGFGSYRAFNGDTFLGHYGAGAAMHGCGRYTWNSSREVYLGNFVANKMKGWGRYDWPDGTRYFGPFEGHRHGDGIVIRGDGAFMALAHFIDGTIEGLLHIEYNKTYEQAQLAMLLKVAPRTNPAIKVSYKGAVDSEMKPDGEGELTWTDRVYRGQFAGGIRSGRGTTTWHDGESYSGEYLRDEPNGVGKFVYKEGRVYEGEWLNGDATGFGVLRFVKENQIYRGNFSEGHPHGRGRLDTLDPVTNKVATAFLGDFVKGVRSGEGTFYFGGQIQPMVFLSDAEVAAALVDRKQDNVTARDIIANSRRDVNDTVIITQLADWYHGNFSHDAMHGHGTYYFADGTIYSGDFANNKYDGFGQVVYSPRGKFRGHMYTGDFAKGVYEGQGEQLFGPGGSLRYVGDFQKGKRHGVGELFEGQIRFEGEFSNGVKHGKGAEFDMGSGAVIRSGMWSNGKLLTPD